MQKKELCFIGAGGHATNNLYPAALLAGAAIPAVATRHLESAGRALASFGSGGRAYASAGELLEREACKNVAVVAQAEDAFPLVCQCLRAGRNVFTEKPLGLSLREAELAARLAEENGTALMVGFMKRFAPVYRRLKALIDEAPMGAVRSFRAVMAVDATAWCKTPETFVYQVVIHFLDLICCLFGEPEKVCGFSCGAGRGLSQSISVRCPGGVVGAISFENRPAWSREYEALEVTFEDGFACAEDLFRLTVHRAAPPVAAPWRELSERDESFLPNAAPMSGATRDLYLRGFVGELEHFLTCCETGAQPVCNGEANCRTMRLCERVLTELR